MQLGAIIGAIILFLGLGTWLLGIYAPLPGAEPTRQGILTKLAVCLIAVLNAVPHAGDPRPMLLYVGLGAMFVGLDVMLMSLILKFWSLRKRR
jgi:hypothetical protein